MDIQPPNRRSRAKQLTCAYGTCGISMNWPVAGQAHSKFAQAHLYVN